MTPISADARVWIATGHTDMRRGMRDAGCGMRDAGAFPYCSISSRMDCSPVSRQRL